MLQDGKWRSRARPRSCATSTDPYLQSFLSLRE